MADFADIRPYGDEEVAPVLASLLRDNECIDAVAKLRAPRLFKLAPALVRPFARRVLQRQFGRARTVYELQTGIKPYMDRMLEGSTSQFTVSGIENLNPQRAYLFISNHRDIALDPAFVNYALYHNGLETVRIAIGDNLLSKPFAADLMRLNKSFIVPRSVRGPRQMLAAYRKLSAYIRHSLLEDNASIWIAQREGRAKDGNDATEVAVMKMLAMAQTKEEGFAGYMEQLQIVPVSISYEWDPLDAAKAKELTLMETDGRYEKAEHEDLQSIADGILGDKGHVHVSFAPPLPADISDAPVLAAALDEAIIRHYHLHPSNILAYQALYGEEDWRQLGLPPLSDQQKQLFDKRIAGIEPAYRDKALAIYARPVVNQLRQRGPAC